MHAWQFSEFGPLFNLRLSELPDSRAGSNDRDYEESGNRGCFGPPGDVKPPAIERAITFTEGYTAYDADCQRESSRSPGNGALSPDHIEET
jgi:hypothetical protein